MSCSLFRLRFDTAAHFGTSDSAQSLEVGEDHFRADTLFSALCQTALTLWGEEGVTWLAEQIQSGEVAFSDSMPYVGEHLLLPKPCFHTRHHQEVPAPVRKMMKKLTWIPVSAFSDFAASLQGGPLFDVQRHQFHFGDFSQTTKVSVTGLEEPKPYQVSAFTFSHDAGLWFLAQYRSQEQERRLRTLVTALGMSGIGGKVSAGYGRFHVAECVRLDDAAEPQYVWLREALGQDNSPSWLLLTSSLPREEELERVLDGAFYQVVRRGGFVQSETFAPDAVKKQTQYYLAAGAVTNRRFHGALYVVAEKGNHPVYRYSVPMMLGVRL